jgi:hypothetical protein
MGLIEIAAIGSLIGSLASAGTSIATGVKSVKTPAAPDPAAAAAEARRKQEEAQRGRRGRQSTLTTAGGGLSEQPTLGRPSLLGSASQGI